MGPYREGEIDVGGLFPAHVDVAGSGADDVLAKQTGIDVDQRCGVLFRAHRLDVLLQLLHLIRLLRQFCLRDRETRLKLLDTLLQLRGFVQGVICVSFGVVRFRVRLLKNTSIARREVAAKSARSTKLLPTKNANPIMTKAIGSPTQTPNILPHRWRRAAILSAVSISTTR